MKNPTKTQREIHAAVVKRNEPIADVSKRFAVSPSTVRRALDRVTESELQRDGGARLAGELLSLF